LTESVDSGASQREQQPNTSKRSDSRAKRSDSLAKDLIVVH